MKGVIKSITAREAKEFLLPLHYPKGENKNYVLGEYQEVKVVEVTQ